MPSCNENIDYTNKSEIKIFLASSIHEFENERNKIGDLVRRMQDDLLEKGIRINLFECEFEDNAMVKGRKQEQYNQKLRESDIMILLIGNRTGEFTFEEYKVSKEVKEIERFIFFKKCETENSVTEFREVIGLDVLEGGFKNKIEEYEEEEELYAQIKDIINNSIEKIDEKDLEKEDLKKYKFIFLQGNKDIENDKYAISNFIRNLNDKYKKHHVYFNFFTNEDISNITEKDMEDCSGFFIIIGKDIDERIYKDFDNAYKYFTENDSPDLRPFVRKDIKERTKKAEEFIKYIGDNLQQYYGEYVDIYRIKYEINNKVDDMKTSNAVVEIIDGSICIDGEEILALDKIPMFSNNEQLIELKEKFEKIEDEYLELKSSDKTKHTEEEANKLEEITEQYYKYKKDIQDLENQIFDFSKKFSKEAGKNNLTKKQIAAYKCLERGDLQSAKEILNIDDINNDIDHIEAEQESGRKKLCEFIQELISRAETYDLDINNPDRAKEIYASYERAIKVEEDNNLPRDTFLIFAEFCNKQEDYVKAAELLQKYLNWAEYNHISCSENLSIKLSKFYELSGEFEKAKNTIKSLYDFYERELNTENHEDLTVVKCKIDLAKADLLCSEAEKLFDVRKLKESKKNINEAVFLYLNIIKILNNNKYIKNDVAVYYIIRSEYGLFKYIANLGLFNKIVDNFFKATKSWIDYHNFSTKFEDLQEIKIGLYYKYANYQFNKIIFGEKNYSEIVGIYDEILDYVKAHLFEKPKYYNSVMFDSFSKLEQIYKIYGLYKNLISLYDDELDVINNTVVILPDNKNSFRGIDNLINKKNQAIENYKKQTEKYKELIEDLKKTYYEVAENSLKEKNLKKAISVYRDAISYIKNDNDFVNENNIFGRAIRDYFLCEIYSHIAEVESKNNKPKDAIKNYEKCLQIQVIFKKISFEKYNVGDYELFQYKILQEMIKEKRLKDAIEFREKALKDIGIEISKNLASNELVKLGIDFTDKKISDALKIQEQQISEFVPNKNPKYFGEIQAVFVDSNNNPITGYAVNLYDSQEKLGQAHVGTDAKISFYKVPAGWYRIELVDKENNDKELMSKYLYVNGADVTNFKLIYPRKQLTIKLVDDINNPLQGATFNIYNSEGDYIKEVVTGEEGIAYVKFLDDVVNTYYFKQVHIDGNYVMDETIYKFKIDDENRTHYAMITNKRFKGRFAIQVTDKNENPVSGLNVRIYNSNKDEVITIATNENGQAGVKNLPLGKYYYKFIDKEEMNEFIIKEKDEIVIRKIKED